MIKNKYSTIALTVVILFGIGLFYIGTDGFTAYTAETARTKQLIDDQPAFPLVTLEDSNEQMYDFTEFEGKYVFMTFIYTSCTDVCLELEVNQAAVKEQIPEAYIGEDIVFLTISFDPEYDTPEVLDKYRSYFEADGETWRMTRIPDQEELDNLLKEFGVIVIPEDNGHFTHNSAFYLVDPEGYLMDVMDYTLVDEAADKVNSILETEVGE